MTFDDVPPPGAGFVTVTVADPAAAISAAGIYATSCEPPIKEVAMKLPFHSTKAFGRFSFGKPSVLS